MATQAFSEFPNLDSRRIVFLRRMNSSPISHGIQFPKEACKVSEKDRRQGLPSARLPASNLTVHRELFHVWKIHSLWISTFAKDFYQISSNEQRSCSDPMKSCFSKGIRQIRQWIMPLHDRNHFMHFGREDQNWILSLSVRQNAEIQEDQQIRFSWQHFLGDLFRIR
jgi:hypothetical protein